MSDIQVSLPSNLITIHMPEFRESSATYTANSTRVTEQINTRVTRGGHTRVTRDVTYFSRPEMILVSVPSNLQAVHLPREE